MNAAALPQIRVIGDGFPHAEPGGPFGSDLIVAPDILHVASLAAMTPAGRDAVLFLVQSLEDETLVSFAVDIRVGDDGALTRRFLAASDIVTLSEADAAWLFPGAGRDEVIDRVLGLGPSLVALATRKGTRLGTRGARWSVPEDNPGLIVEMLRTITTVMTCGTTANDLRDQHFEQLRVPAGV